MSETIIQVENLGKQYRLGQVGTGTLSHDLNRWWQKLRGKEDPYLRVGEINDRSKKGESDLVWALKDINFEVKQGEVLGIIGKNGAGKSTLLKILSRVTGPSVGDVRVKGRIASLLEVGTGFHPDLSGRENVFLNGAILGMTKEEIKGKFDEIVDFSGVERYIDTPVKRYSSGMYVRLAFAVAAHLEPEILIVDEVLSVGDIEFQNKCLGKMKNVAGQGRTVLFVSHNMSAMKALCSRAVFLKKGLLVLDDTTNKVVDEYMVSENAQKGIVVFENDDTSSFLDGKVFLKKIQLTDKFGKNKTSFDVKESFFIDLELEVLKEKYSISVHFYLKNQTGTQVMVAMDNNYSPYKQNPISAGTHRYKLKIPENFLNEGNYFVEAVICTNPTTQYYIAKSDCLYFTLTDDMSELGVRGDWQREWPDAVIRYNFEWEIS